MSIEEMQQILWNGAADQIFLEQLLRNPPQSLKRFELKPEEAAYMADNAVTLEQLAQVVENYRKGNI